MYDLNSKKIRMTENCKDDAFQQFGEIKLVSDEY